MNLKSFSLLSLVGSITVLSAPPEASLSIPTPAPLPPEVQSLLDAADARIGGELHIGAEDPLAAAWLFARQITGDHDAACRYQLRCIDAMIKAGRVEAAARLTREISDYRSALGSLRCAEALLENGSRDLALEQMERVEKVLGVVKPWQQNVIRVRMAAVGAQVGWDDARIAPWLKPLEMSGDRFGARALVLVRRMLKQKTFDATGLEELMNEKTARKNPIPEMVEAAGLLLRLAPDKEGEKNNPQQMNALLSAFERVLSDSHAYPAPAMLDLAEFWHMRGDHGKARAALARAEPQIGYHLDGGPELYHRMALLWELKGATEEVRPFFEALEVRARALAPMYRPAALAWLGACWREIGELDRGAVLVDEALKEASANPNPRMRLIGCLEICLSHGRTGTPLPASLAGKLECLLKGDAPTVQSE